MRALVYDPDAPHGLRLGEAPDPIPSASQAMIRVAAASLNFADVAFLRDRQAPGAVPGFDLMTNPQVTGAVLEVTGGETLVNTLE
jgi:NADPH2:quinone reductase